MAFRRRRRVVGRRRRAGRSIMGRGAYKSSGRRTRRRTRRSRRGVGWGGVLGAGAAAAAAYAAHRAGLFGRAGEFVKDYFKPRSFTERMGDALVARVAGGGRLSPLLRRSIPLAMSGRVVKLGGVLRAALTPLPRPPPFRRRGSTDSEVHERDLTIDGTQATARTSFLR